MVGQAGVQVGGRVGVIEGEGGGVDDVGVILIVIADEDEGDAPRGGSARVDGAGGAMEL